MKKRLISLLLALVMCVTLCLPAFAAGDEAESSAAIMKEDGLNTEFSSSLLGKDTVYDDEGILRSIVNTYRINVPYDGNYHTLDSSLELTPGTVSFIGTWGPSYASLTVEIISDDGSYGTMTSVASGVTGTLRIRQEGTYIIHVKAVSRSLSGTINFTL